MTKTQRYVAAAVLVFAVFASSYVYAAARSSGRVRSAADATRSDERAACSCCSAGASAGPARSVEAALDGGLQRISVATGGGSWDPAEILLRAGVPAEIAFARGEGCLAEVVFPGLGLSADLTRGGATVRVPPLEAGEYTFTCGMRMVSGKLIVR